MDESLQKELMTRVAEAPMREHWVWMNGRVTGPRCRHCEFNYPQSREACIRMHPSEGGEPRLVLEPPPR